MKIRVYLRNYSSSIIILIVLSLFLPSCSLVAGESLNQNNYQKVVANDLSSGKIVILYFHSPSIKDSLDALQPLKTLTKKYPDETALYQIEADKNPRLIGFYGVQYLPTVFVLRPKEGIVRSFEVDVDTDIVEKLIAKKERTIPGTEQIAAGIAAGKPSLLFFMADWCFYCQKLLPGIRRFKSDFGEKVNVHSINVDYEIIPGEYLVSGVPEIVILDSHGLIVDRYGFPSGYETYLKSFRKLGLDMKKEG